MKTKAMTLSGSIDRPDGRNRPVGRYVLAVAAIAAALIAPAFIYPVFLMKVYCFALFAAAFNLLIGYAGLLSFGHAAFFGGAAYLAAYGWTAWSLSPVAGILIGTIFAGLLGVLFGWLAIKRQGIYFAMITLALAQMFYFLCVQLEFTGGEDGIQNVPRGTVLGLVDLAETMNIYYFVLVIVAVSFIFIWRIINSPFGNILRAIRDNEARAVSLGYDVQRYKLKAFILSAMFAGAAGSTKALVFQMATLIDVEWHMSGQVVLMTLLGGIGTYIGPLVGAAVVVALQSGLATSELPVTVVMGLIFVMCVMLFRKGIVGEIQDRLEKRRGASGK